MNNSTDTEMNKTNKNISLEELGYNKDFEEYKQQNNLGHFTSGRVICEHKERYIVKTEKGEYSAEVIGKLRFTAQSRLDFPAVGDWVAISECDESTAFIHDILGRQTIIQRKAAGKNVESQIVACNVDVAFIVQSVNRDLNLNRIERYLTICSQASIKSIIVISKTDLIEEENLNNILESIKSRIPNVPVVALSNVDNSGLDELKEHIFKSKTYCMLGSSGVGKSTLINKLAGSELMETKDISESIDRGRHTTTHRELIILDNGGIFIDNPGMREVGLTDMTEGLENTFGIISSLASECKYKDCQHIHESGCAVLKAVDSGEISHEIYENYIRLSKEKAHYESTNIEKKRKSKDLSKLIKQVKKKKQWKI
jgi:ribosome biogenesis GTPase